MTCFKLRIHLYLHTSALFYGSGIPASDFHLLNSFKGPISIPIHLRDEKNSALVWSGHSAPLEELGRTRKGMTGENMMCFN